MSFGYGATSYGGPPGPLPVLDITTKDTYTYLTCPQSTKLTLQISNAAVYIGFGFREPGVGGNPIYPPNDEPFLPVTGSIERPVFDEIRVKSYTPATPARAIIRAIQ